MEASEPTRTISLYGDQILIWESELEDGGLKLVIFLPLVDTAHRAVVREQLPAALRSTDPQIAGSSPIIFRSDQTDGWYYVTIPDG